MNFNLANVNGPYFSILNLGLDVDILDFSYFGKTLSFDSVKPSDTFRSSDIRFALYVS
jgi:hypothetical protein